MAYEQKDNSGAAFVNKNKTTDKHPDYTGKIMVAGDVCYLEIWRKTTTAGGHYRNPKSRKHRKSRFLTMTLIFEVLHEYLFRH